MRIANKRNLVFYLIMLFIFNSILPLPGKEFYETKEQKEKRMEWWREARFGMFIHWGLYSMAARHEWVKRFERMTDEEYKKYFDLFDPDLYNPEEWARLAKEAGMKYVVITAKHHEGFCLWDSKYTDYKSTNTPCGRDLLKPFVKAFRNQGLRVGFYYSLLDWHHPEYTIDRNHPMYENREFRIRAEGRDIKKYAQYVRNQVRELLTEFGQIDLLFLDYSFAGKDGKGRNDWESLKLLKLIRSLQPNVIINDRLDLLDVQGGWDFRTPEQFIPREWVKVNGERVPWETCQTFSGSWGYYRDEYTWKSIPQLVRMLIETVSKGGNLLLNVGPTARGTFDVRAIERLKGMGRWMKFNSRSIYGCTQPPDDFKKVENCLLTYNPKTRRLYVHLLVWPPVGKLYLDGYSGKVKYAQLLEDGSEIKFTKPRKSPVLSETIEHNTLILNLPIKKPESVVPVIELFLK